MNQKAVVFISCLVISIIFWFFTSMSRNYETTITLPVSYHNLPFTKNIEGDLPLHLDFHFRGTGFELFSTYLRRRPDSIVVDINAAMGRSGKINLPSLSLKNQLPGDLEPYRIDPEIIAPAISPRKGKKVPVELVIGSLEFRDRFGASGRIILRPDSIDIAGSNELLDSVSKIKTEPLTLKDIHEDYFGGIYLSKRLPKGLQVAQTYVHYFIPVEELTEGVVEVPVELPLAQKGKITLIPSRVKVFFKVGLKRYGQVSPHDFRATAELNPSLLPQNLEVELKQSPPGIRDVRIEPRFIDYLIKE